MRASVHLRHTRQRRRIMKVLLDATFPLSGPQIAVEADVSYDCVYEGLIRMEEREWVHAPGGQVPRGTQGTTRYYMLTEKGRTAAEEFIKN